MSLKRPLPPSTASAPPPPLKRPRTQEASTNAATVRESYNSTNDGRNLETRAASPISELRYLNNWVKSVLLKKYIQAGDIVLDLCGGKGGDLNKWQLGNISHLILADIADVSVKEAIKRYNGNKRINFTANFIHANCHKDGLRRAIERLQFNNKCALVSCQFALHYAFETELQITTMLRTVSESLKPGGFFVGTIPCANHIVREIENSPTPSFGNKFYSVTFDKKDFSAFGAKYVFELGKAVPGVPEYLVHFETLVKLASKAGLTYVDKQHFKDFFDTHHVGENVGLLKRMRKDRINGPLSNIEGDIWDIFHFYDVFVFKKKGEEAYVDPVPYSSNTYFDPSLLLKVDD